MDVWTHRKLQPDEQLRGEEPVQGDETAEAGATPDTTHEAEPEHEPPPGDGRGQLEVSARTLRDVRFRERFRGYHPDDVDEFLEQVAEGIDYLQGKLRVLDPGGGPVVPAPMPGTPAAIENDEALRRTLVLAQRTAQLAIQEARHEAARIQEEAKRQAGDVMTRAEDAARHTVEATNAQLRVEVGKLEAARDRLRADVADLERYLDEQRQQLQATLGAALAKVEEVVPRAPEPAPEAAEVDVPPVPWPEPVEREQVWGGPEVSDQHEVDHEETDQEADHEAADEDDAGALAGTAGPDAADPLAQPAAPSGGDLGIWAASDPVDDEMWSGGDAPGAGPGDDDPFIAELRRAITDTSPLGPREDEPEDAPPALDSLYEQEFSSGRRFRRKRR